MIQLYIDHKYFLFFILALFMQRDIEIINGGDNLSASLSSSLSTSAPSLVTTNPEASLYLAKALTNDAEQDYVDGETDSGVLKSRQYVYKELIDTEQVYVKDLQTVLDVSVCLCMSG